jgi:hypothetical protein
MYLIGFFASPLPYIALLALYMSGFAYVGLRGQAPEEDMQGAEAPGSLMPVTALNHPAYDHDCFPEVNEFTPSANTFLYISSDGPEETFADQASCKTCFCLPVRLACLMAGPPEHLRSATLTAHPIRPPPSA